MRRLTLLLLAATAGLSATAQSTISGQWHRRMASPEIVLYAIDNGRLQKLETTTFGEDRSFAFEFHHNDEGFFVIGDANANTPSRKHVFYFKPGDCLNIEVNDSTFTLIHTNTFENQAIAAWNQYILPIQINGLFPTLISYVQFFPMLERTLRTPFSPPSTGNEGFDVAFAKMRNYDLALYTTAFVMSPRGAHPQGEDFPDFYRNLRLSDFTANADVLGYPFAFRLINAVAYIETLVKGERMRSPLQVIDVVEDETLKTELIQNNLANAQQRQSQADARTPRETPQGLTEGELAPNFTYNDVDGNPVSLADFRGKIVYIDVWATWCGPCRRELPHLKTLKEQYKDNPNLVIIGISADAIRDIQKWRDFVAAEELGGIQLHGRTDDDTDIGKLYQVNALPRFFLIDREGRVVSNNAPRPSSDEIVPTLERLLR